MAWPWMAVGFTLAVLLAERVYVPWIYPLKLVSINQVGETKMTFE